MNISAWAIRNPIPIFMLFAILTLLGLVSFRGLGINQWPDVDMPMVVVTITQPGAAASELETDVTRKVEDALVGIRGLDHMRSTIVEGTSTTVIELVIGTDTESALNNVRDAVARIRQSLPADINDPSIVHPNNAGDPFATFTIASDRRSVGELSRLVDEDVTRSLLTVAGVAQVQREGGLTREVRIRLSPQRLQALGTTADFVNTQLRALNLNLPGGKSNMGGGDIGIRTLGSARTIADLRKLPIPLAGGGTAPLGTLGGVEDGFADVHQIARLDGLPVVGFSVIRSQGSPMVQAEEGVRRQLDELRKTLPPDVVVTLVRTQANYTRASYHASIDALLIGATLAIIVIYLFLRNWQSTLIAGLAIPLSVLPTFFIMGWLGYTLNGMTLLALTLVVGILVDDAIVDLENIHRHIDLGKNPMKAALEATDEIGLAVVATTMTIVVVFVPVSFMGGIPGMFFRSFGISVAVSVLFSLLVARTLTPLLAAYMLPAHKSTAKLDTEPFYRSIYMALLRRALRHRWLVMGGAALIFVGSLALVPLIPKGFISNGDTGEATVAIALPSGAAVEQTEVIAQQVTRLLKTRPEVATVFATIGNRGGGMAAVRGDGGSASLSEATLYVLLKPRRERTIGIEQFVTEMSPILKRIPGARIALNKQGATGSSGKNVNLILRGSDGDVLARTAQNLLAEMRGLPVLRDVTSSTAEQRPEIQIQPDPGRAADQGVLVATIGRTARLATQGDVAFNLPKFNAGDQQLDIRVQLGEQDRGDLTAIGNLMVPARRGLVPLSSVADIKLGAGPVQVNRYDRTRQVTLSANLNGATLGNAMDTIAKLPTMRALPTGISQGSMGEAKIMADIFSGFSRAFGFGVLLIYAVLVLLFRGWLQPLTIMGALPLAIGGAFVGLLLGGKELGMMGLIGVIMLMGLVTKNSILLVEYAMRARLNGLDRQEAIMQAGHDRLRPILMTTIAMITGMLPIAFSYGEGTERLSPMAAAVIGGLVTSTLLTLVVIPVAYTLIDDIQTFCRRILEPLWKGRAEESPTPQPAIIRSVSHGPST